MTFHRLVSQLIQLALLALTSSVPLLNLTPERKHVIATYATTRSTANFNIVASAVLSGGMAKRHAEWFASTENDVASILNALVFDGNETTDRADVLKATGSGHQPRHGGFRPPVSESVLLEHEHLQPASLAALRFSGAFVRAITPPEAENTVELRQHDRDTAARARRRRHEAREHGVTEEVEYALRQHLGARGLAVNRVWRLSTPAGVGSEMVPSEQDGSMVPGEPDYRRPSTDSVSFVECASRTSAYAAAWLARRDLLMAVNMGPRATLEWHSHNLFIHVFYTNRRKEHNTYGFSFKLSDYRDFMVNHLSHWDRSESDQNQATMGGAVERECLPRNREPMLSHVTPKGFGVPRDLGEDNVEKQTPWKSVALVPFWGGSKEQSGGNSHSNAKRDTKIQQLAGTVCSAMKPFGRVVVGVCNARDRDSVLNSLSVKWGIGPSVSLRLPSLPFNVSMRLRDEHLLIGFLKGFKMKIPPGSTREDKANQLRENAQAMARIWKMFDLNEVFLTNGTESDLMAAQLIVFEFDCAVGVHLPYHLLQTTQSLLGWNKPDPAPRKKTRGDIVLNEMDLELKKSVVDHGSGAASRGPLAKYSWSDVSYVYFTEADQLTWVASDKVLAGIVSMMNATSYVSPARMQMKGNSILKRSGFDEKSIGEVVREAWRTESRSTRHRRLRLANDHRRLQATGQQSKYHRRVLVGKSATKSSDPKEVLAIENICIPGTGEPGYLGPARVHVATPSGP